MDILPQAPTVIIANGRFPDHPLPLSVIEKAEYIVCTDGAANDFIDRGGKPDAIVGDCDSISEEYSKRYAHILHPNPDQETNDLTKSVQFCVQNGRKEIVIVGGTGKREDHTLGNISLLADYMETAKVMMVTNYGIFTPMQGSTEFTSHRGQQVSLFSIDRTAITTHNLKYPLYQKILTNWWQGTLNESLGDTFTVDSLGRVIVFRVYA
ncbi:MAG: thiamine diphosphokinase [Proteiniphilum sp.]